MHAMIKEVELNKFLRSFKSKFPKLIKVCYIFNTNRFIISNSDNEIREYVEGQKEIFCNFNEIHAREDSDNLTTFNQVSRVYRADYGGKRLLYELKDSVIFYNPIDTNKSYILGVLVNRAKLTNSLGFFDFLQILNLFVSELKELFEPRHKKIES